jgi:hypothetical protein
VRRRGRCDGVNTAPGLLTSRVGHDPFIVWVLPEPHPRPRRPATARPASANRPVAIVSAWRPAWSFSAPTTDKCPGPSLVGPRQRARRAASARRVRVRARSVRGRSRTSSHCSSRHCRSQLPVVFATGVRLPSIPGERIGRWWIGRGLTRSSLHLGSRADGEGDRGRRGPSVRPKRRRAGTPLGLVEGGVRPRGDDDGLVT